MTAEAATAVDEFLPVRATPCLAKLTAQRSWATSLAVRAGNRLVGIRVTDEATAHDVDEVFGALRAPEHDEAAPPHISVEIPAPTGGSARGLHLLYREHVIVGRRRDREALLVDLVEVVREVTSSDVDDLPAVHATALVVEGREVLLLPVAWHADLLVHQDRLAREGVDVLASRTHLVDLTGRTVVSRELVGVSLQRPACSLPLAGWFLRASADRTTGMRPAPAVQAALLTVANLRQVEPGPVLQGLADLARSLPFVGVPAHSGASTLATVRELVATRNRGGGFHPASP